ncbi:MAG: hypothetical protein ACXWP6_03270 [Ktedonobacterales bacterium]
MDTLFRRATILRRLANEAYVLRRCYEQAGRDMSDPLVANVLAENERHLACVLVEALLAFDVTPSLLTPELAERLAARWSPTQAEQAALDAADRRRRKLHAQGEAAASPRQSSVPHTLSLHASGSWHPTDETLDLPIREGGIDADTRRLNVTFDLDSPYTRDALLRQLRDWLARLEASEPADQREEDHRTQELDHALQRWLTPEGAGAD